MIRLWAKVMLDNRIIKDTIYYNYEKLSYESFYDSLTEICHQFDISTPIVLPSHYRNFIEYNITKFLPSDFVEGITFDKLTIENALI